MTVHGCVQRGDGDVRLIGALAVKDAVAAGTDGSQRLRRQRLEPRLRTLRLDHDRTLTVVTRTALITARTQAADYVVRDARFPPRQTARERRVLVLQERAITRRDNKYFRFFSSPCEN